MANSPKLSLVSSLLEDLSAPLPSNEIPLVVMHAAVTAGPDVQRCLVSIINDATKTKPVQEGICQERRGEILNHRC